MRPGMKSVMVGISATPRNLKLKRTELRPFFKGLLVDGLIFLW